MVGVRGWLAQRRWLLPAIAWVTATVVVAMAAQVSLTSSRAGLTGSQVALPLKASEATRSARPATMTTPVKVLVRHATTTSYVVEITPISVVEGTLSDLHLADPSEVAGMRVFYVTYTLRYVSGDVIGHSPKIVLRIKPSTGEPPGMPHGFKDWNQSGCVAPRTSSSFGFGQGVVLTTCQMTFVRPGGLVDVLQLAPVDVADVQWPVSQA